MKVVIIEDEKPAARRLNRMLEELNISPLAMLHSVEEAINWFSNNEQPDLLFLDIQLSDGLSFEIFDELTITSAIIFTTAYDKYALKAFKLNSVDYLLKPIESEELELAISKYKSYFNPNDQASTVSILELKKLLQPATSTFKKRFVVKIGQKLKMINCESIACFFSENKATHINTFDKRNYIVEDTLDQIEEKLSTEVFFRVNRKFIVNINAIQDIIAYKNSRLKIKIESFSGEDIIVSRERVKDFKTWLG